MRPWIMALASGVAAIAAAAVLAAPVLSAGPLPLVLPHLVMRAPALVIAAIAVYAFAAMLSSTASLVGTSLATRRRLARLTLRRTAGESEWMAAFGTTGLRRLAVPLAPASPGRPTIVLSDAFDLRGAQREIARLHYVWLARTHFFSALIVLGGIVILGLVQEVQPLLPLLPVAIPMIAAAVAFAAAMLFAVLGRLAVDIAVEPLFETMTRLPVERSEAGLLRRVVELLERGRQTIPMPSEAAPPPLRQFDDEIVAALDRGHRMLLEAIGDLAERTSAVGPAIEAAVTGLDGAIRGIAVAPAPSAEVVDDAKLVELRTAVEALTAVLERFATVAEQAEEASGEPGDASSRPAPASPRLARELRQLLREIETAP